jgi:hypothetical protein
MQTIIQVSKSDAKVKVSHANKRAYLMSYQTVQRWLGGLRNEETIKI